MEVALVAPTGNLAVFQPVAQGAEKAALGDLAKRGAKDCVLCGLAAPLPEVEEPTVLAQTFGSTVFL